MTSPRLPQFFGPEGESEGGGGSSFFLNIVIEIGAHIDAIRQQRSVEDLRQAQAAYASDNLKPKHTAPPIATLPGSAPGGPLLVGSDPREVVIGVVATLISIRSNLLVSDNAGF